MMDDDDGEIANTHLQFPERRYSRAHVFARVFVH